MTRALLVLIVVLASPAVAQPSGSPADVPTRAIPCAMEGMTLHAAGGDPVVCWDKGCMKLDMRDGATAHAKPAPGLSWLGPVARVADGKVCMGTICRTLGRKLTAAIATARKSRDPEAGPLVVPATTDLQAVVVNQAAWSVPADRVVTFSAPSIYRQTREKSTTVGVVPAGDLLVVWWSACAGPCTKFAIADSSGRPKGPEGEGGGGVFQLDRQRFVVWGEYGSVHVYELGTARPRGELLTLTQDPMSASLIRSGDEALLAMYGKGAGVEVAKISAYQDRTLPPQVTETQYLPRCAAN